MQNHIESRNFLRTLTFFSEEKGLLSNKPPGTVPSPGPYPRGWTGERKIIVGAGRRHMKGLIALDIGTESPTKDLYFGDTKVLNPRATHLRAISEGVNGCFFLP